MRSLTTSLITVPALLVSASTLAQAGENTFHNDSKGYVTVTVCSGSGKATAALIAPGKAAKVAYEGRLPEVVFVVWDTIHQGGDSWTDLKVKRYTLHDMKFDKPAGHIDADDLKMADK